MNCWIVNIIYIYSTKESYTNDLLSFQIDKYELMRIEWIFTSYFRKKLFQEMSMI